MSAEERQHRILALARREGRVEVSGAAVEFGVARETIRRDLNELERRGLVRRTHGGAYPVESAGFETTLAHRENLHVAEKRRIAAAAVETARRGRDGLRRRGLHPAARSPRHAAGRTAQLTVVTASLATAAAVAESDGITVLLLGGRVRGRTLATVDHWATAHALRLRHRPGVPRRQRHLPRVRTHHPRPGRGGGQGTGGAQSLAQTRASLGFHTKFGADSFCRFAEIADFETIVTDTGLPAAEAHRYALLGPQVLRV